ncbi:MAG TPA: ribose 5-phosphate isomerase A [Thermoplasmata archaeon]|nr:ribose 5-phosphate isomerase A [Thermoplasmata archaeon]
MPDGSDRAKAAAAARAVERLVRPGLRLALGTGSTAAEAVRAIAARFPQGRFDCVASSRATEELARSLGIAVRPLAAEDRFDLMLDGADEVTPDLALTKGGGGALLREKLLAHLAREVAIVVDASKLVARLGERHPIPVEVVPFARPVLERELADDGYAVRRRRRPDGGVFATDNGNEILDLTPPRPLDAPAAAEERLKAHVGVVEVGLFVGYAHRLFVGYPDGRVEERAAPVPP